MRVASIGECMVELADVGADHFKRGFGGDTLNTAVYLARLGVDVSFVTALGDDPLSASMLAAWKTEGVENGEVQIVPGRMPGLYLIQRDARGERSFLYWRDRAPAREYFDRADDAALDRLAHYDWLYFSGISLSLYGEGGRARLAELLRVTRGNGGRIAFDSNFRARGWSDRNAARRAIEAILPYVDLALPTLDDEQALFADADADAEACARRIGSYGVSEVVVKTGGAGCLVVSGRDRLMVAPRVVLQPVDTTAAGDSFNAAYLAARIAGAAPDAAALAGHSLAGAVVMRPGAIIPRDAMPSIPETKVPSP